MFLRCSKRNKDGKLHRYWSVVENRRVGRKVHQRHVLYLGEINDSEREAWCRAISVFDEGSSEEQQLKLYPSDRDIPAHAEVLLYDLTSTYFESSGPFEEGDKRRYGYSRDKRSDCVQVVIALVVSTEGLPLAYEVMPGNTLDNQTLRKYLKALRRLRLERKRTTTRDELLKAIGAAGKDAGRDAGVVQKSV